MDYEYHQSPFSKAVLTSVFVGFFATLACLIFNVIFRESTGYLPADVINVSSLIFAVNLIFFVIGLLYFVFLRYVKKGNIIFAVVFGVLTLFLAWRADFAHMGDSAVTTSEFRVLLIGTIIIMGIGVELIPVLARNDKFVESVL